MAETIHLFLKARGKPIDGESSQTSVGRDKSIECIYYEQLIDCPYDRSTGVATSRHTHRPIKIRKRIDRASPLLFAALTGRQEIEGRFLFYRPNPAGDGTTQQFYTVEIRSGRITGIRQYVPDMTVHETSAEHPLEEVEFTFSDIIWTWVDGGVMANDSWARPS
jgi:type VI secretion system secreted protein Hcp